MTRTLPGVMHLHLRVAEAALSDSGVPFVMACARVDNRASQRAFAKAGFRIDREFDDVPNGRYVLMVRLA